MRVPHVRVDPADAANAAVWRGFLNILVSREKFPVRSMCHYEEPAMALFGNVPV